MSEAINFEEHQVARGHESFAAQPPLAQVDSPPVLHELMSPEVNVQRIMSTASRWFVGAVLAVAIVMGLLLSSGWRPSMLPTGLETLWWAAFLVVTASIGLIGWSGCPILEVSVPVADRNKTRTMQFGTGMFIVGSAAALLAVLLGPAG
ncbi:hypothetical protein BH11ACT2_BH11ACT2_01330 [soil metagenome]